VTAAEGDVPAEKPKKPRAKKAEGKGAPVEAETQVLESSPVAAENAEGAQAADAAPAKKPRAKKVKTEEA
jgi:trigger factor